MWKQLRLQSKRSVIWRLYEDKPDLPKPEAERGNRRRNAETITAAEYGGYNFRVDKEGGDHEDDDWDHVWAARQHFVLSIAVLVFLAWKRFALIAVYFVFADHGQFALFIDLENIDKHTMY